MRAATRVPERTGSTLRRHLVRVAAVGVLAMAPVAIPAGSLSAGPPAGITTVPPADGSDAGYVDNPFIPTDANLGDCVSALPRPECGSEARGGPGQWLTFTAMTAALVFIGWRVGRAIRRRDRELAARSDA